MPSAFELHCFEMRLVAMDLAEAASARDTRLVRIRRQDLCPQMQRRSQEPTGADSDILPGRTSHMT